MQISGKESRQQTVGFDYGIRRHPYRSVGGSGWELCARRGGRVVKRRYFSDVLYGNPDRACAAAIAYRERLLMTNSSCKVPAKTADAIYDGVSAVRKGGQVVGYTAETRLSPDQLLTKTYRTAQRGPAAALTLAIGERKRQLGEKGAELLAANKPSCAIQLSTDKDEHCVAPEAASDADATNAAAPDLQDIYRLPEDGCAPGWRVLTKKNRRRVSRLFLDRDHGGRAGAFARALEFRGPPAAPRRKKST
ncbi:hypothetical protein [Lysobacter sp. CA199]|uniref:hypothetical protein n=1 Tax=Lysobacter sp. CA199 TaxID=3455608 RepID=UPI003F8D7D8D